MGQKRDILRQWFRSFPASVWWALAVTLMLRVAYVYRRLEPGGGLGEFHQLALHLVRDGVLSYDGKMPTAFRLPGYPLVLSVLFRLTGDCVSRGQIHALHFVLHSLTLLLIYRLLARFTSPSWGVLAVWLCALNPARIEMDCAQGLETLSALQMTLIAWSLARLSERPQRWVSWAESGLLISWSLVTKSTLLFLPWLLLAASRLRGLLFAERPDWRKAALLIVCSYSLVAPWIARNWVLFHRVVPFEDGMGWHMFYLGTLKDKNLEPGEPEFPKSLQIMFERHDWQQGPWAKAEALKNIRAHPLRWIKLCVSRLQYMWFCNHWAENGFNLTENFQSYWQSGRWGQAALKTLFKVAEVLFAVFAVVGLWATWPLLPARMLAGLLLYQHIHLLIGLSPRYVTPMLPLVCVFSAAGMLAAARSARAAS